MAGSASIATSLTAAPAVVSRRPKSRLKVGIIGTGERGRVLLREVLNRPDVDLTAICDIDQFVIDKTLAQAKEQGKKAPKVYTGSKEAWRTMIAKEKLDGIIIATPWEYHAAMAIGAMEAGIPVGCEVVAGITLQDHWNVLRTQQKTGTPYMLLENVCCRRDVMAALNMTRQGVFGEIVHLEGGYEHDLRNVKFNSGTPGKPYDGGLEFGAKGWSEARWRTDHSVLRNGELYPSHGIGPCAMQANINRGNRFTRITSYASKPRGLHDYIVKNGGAEHPNAKVKFSLGDIVQTQIGCENGETILLTHDTSLPRPYSLGFRVQGTNGLWMDVNNSVHIEGQSKPHKWDDADVWFEKYDHPLWKKYAEAAAGAGHGGMDFFVVRAWLEALKSASEMPIDIYDAVAWSAITPLSEQSIAEGNRTLDFPDFTGGKWKDRKPIFALTDA